jgi:hypothetical protein
MTGFNSLKREDMYAARKQPRERNDAPDRQRHGGRYRAFMRSASFTRRHSEIRRHIRTGSRTGYQRRIAALAVAGTLVLLGLIGSPVHAAEKGRAVETRHALAAQWHEVKTKYPEFAIAYMRREAFIYLMGRRIRKGARVKHVDVCEAMARLGLRLPASCGPMEFDGPLPNRDISHCFNPPRVGAEPPTAREAEACVQGVMGTRLP